MPGCADERRIKNGIYHEFNAFSTDSRGILIAILIRDGLDKVDGKLDC